MDAVPISPRAKTHSPDLVVVDASGHRHAIEGKLTPKSERELRAIVLALASSSRYATVSYYVSGQTTRTAVDRAVQAAAYALHAPNPIHVHEYVPAHSPRR